MRLVYVGPFAFPSSNANSLRVRGMIEALLAAGHEVHVVCLGDERFDGQIDGVRVTQIPEYTDGNMPRIFNGLRGLFLGNATTHWLVNNGIRPDALILYGTHLGYLLRLARFGRAHGIRLFLDVVEWYQPSHLPGGAFGPFAFANELSMRIFARRADGIFVISRFLEKHFARLGLPVLRVPPLFKQTSRPVSLFRIADGKLHVCYVGTPGRKELFDELFAGLKHAVAAEASVQMHLVGMTMENAKAQGLPVDEFGGIVKFHGRVPNQVAVSIVSACDFMVLLRPDQRFTRAGFPSKVVESLCCGTPVLTNLISDLSDYLKDGENAIIVRGTDPHSFSESIQRATRLDVESLSTMRRSALASSRAFRPEAHASRIDEFVYRNSRRVLDSDHE